MGLEVVEVEDVEEREEDRSDEPQSEFKIHFLQNARFSAFQNKDLLENFMKWGFGQEMTIFRFRYEELLREQDYESFLNKFFAAKDVMGAMAVNTGCRVLTPGKVKVEAEEILTNQVSMRFLSKFEEAGCISNTGRIKGRLEEDFEGIPIHDLVREAMLLEESELYPEFTENDRRELLFLIFQHLVIGGASNQYDEYVEPYFAATKAIYKDMLTVQRNASGDTQVVSKVFRIHSIGDGGSLFPKDHLSNFCYLSLDPLSRHATVWYFGYKPFW